MHALEISRLFHAASGLLRGGIAPLEPLQRGFKLITTQVRPPAPEDNSRAEPSRPFAANNAPPETARPSTNAAEPCSICATSGCTASFRGVTKPTTPVTFYMRELPSGLVPFSSKEGRELFTEALLQGTAESFFKLMEQFRTQDEPSYCGLASLAMVLNALAIDPRRPWKGPWRWFTEELLDCCEPLDRVRTEGIVFHKVASLARCNGAEVDERPFGSFTEAEFRAAVIDAVTRQGSNSHLLVSYSRRALNQTGDGHFSPVGGYHRAKDLVLVLDVASFKYAPHWAPLSTLYEAMSYIDKATGQPRGYLVLSRRSMVESVMFTLGIREEGWEQGHRFLTEGAAAAARRAADLLPLSSPAWRDSAGKGWEASRLASGAAAAASAAAVGAKGAGGAVVGGNVPTLAFKEAAPSLIRAAEEAVAGVVCAIPRPGLDFIVSREGQPAHAGPHATCIPFEQRHHLLFELRAMPLFRMVEKALGLEPTEQPAALAAPPSRNTCSRDHQHGPGCSHHSTHQHDANCSHSSHSLYSSHTHSHSDPASAPSTSSTAAPSLPEDPPSTTGREDTEAKEERLLVGDPLLAERASVLLLLLPASMWDMFPGEPLRALLRDLTDLTRESRGLLRTELLYLKYQMEQLDEGGLITRGPVVPAQAPAPAPAVASPASDSEAGRTDDRRGDAAAASADSQPQMPTQRAEQSTG